MKIKCLNNKCEMDYIDFKKSDIKNEIRYKKEDYFFEGFDPSSFKLNNFISCNNPKKGYTNIFELKKDFYDKCVRCPICNDKVWLFKKTIGSLDKDKCKFMGKKIKLKYPLTSY